MTSTTTYQARAAQHRRRGERRQPAYYVRGHEPRLHQVGLGLHSVNDIEEEVASLHTEMTQFGDEISRQLFGDDPHNRAFDLPLPGVPREKVDYYHSVWRPLMTEWLAFRDAHGHSFWQNLPLSGAWDRVQDFRARLLASRRSARDQKLHLTSPEPIPPKHDVDLGDVAKTAGYVAVGVGGLLGVVLLLRALPSRRGD